jgi:hypothetical protein
VGLAPRARGWLTGRGVSIKPLWEWTEDDVLVLMRDGIKESIDLHHEVCFAFVINEPKRNEPSKVKRQYDIVWS